jgi:hypothetical protein
LILPALSGSRNLPGLLPCTSATFTRFLQLATALREDLPVHDRAAEAVEQTGEVVERSADVDVGDIDVPVLVGGER